MKAWITKCLIYALIPLFFFIEGYGDGPSTDILNRASQDIGTSSAVTPITPVAREVEAEEPQVAKEEACLCFPCVEEWRCPARWLIEGRVSYFRPQDKILRKIYGEGWADYQFLLGYYFTCRWSLLALGGYRERTGHALNLYTRTTRTKVQEVPLSLEVRYNYICCPCWKLYLGMGPSVLFFKETLYLPGAKEHNSKEMWGGYVETGTLINIYKDVLLDIFVGYSCYPKEGFSSAVNNGSGASLKLGGLQAGLGLGYQF